MRPSRLVINLAVIVTVVLVPLKAAFAQDLELTDLIATVDKSVVRIDVTTGQGKSLGSGFIVDESGLVVTNHHVIAGARSAKVAFQDGKTATVEGTRFFDGRLDLAVLQIKSDKLKLQALSLAEELPPKGAAVVAFGAPQGLSFSASEGIISATREGKELEQIAGKIPGTWLQTTTPISPGNSGGPLVNRKGKVVGVNTMQLVSGQNLNFAISSIDVAKVVIAAKALSLVPLLEGAFKEKSRSQEEEGSSGSAELAADNLPSTAISDFLRRGEQLRLKAKGEFVSQLAKLRDELKDLKDGKINGKLTKNDLRGKKYAVTEVRGRSIVTFPDDQTKKESIAAVDDAVDKLATTLKKFDDSKEGLLTFLTTMAGPALDPNQVGDIGCAYNIVVSQITGSSEFHANIHNKRVVFRGIDTSKFVNGSKINGGVNYVAGTETYTTVGRTRNTIFVVKPLPMELLRSNLGVGPGTTTVAKEMKSATLPTAVMRRWTDKSGKFSVEAKFASRIGEKVVLEKSDGSTIDVNVAILSDEDQAYIKTFKN